MSCAQKRASWVIMPGEATWELPRLVTMFECTALICKNAKAKRSFLYKKEKKSRESKKLADYYFFLIFIYPRIIIRAKLIPQRIKTSLL